MKLPTREAQLRKPFASPFFLYFMFSLLCATLRWQWQGVLWTSVAALAISVGHGIYSVSAKVTLYPCA